MIFEKTAPLLIFPNSFNDFDSYFKSLSRSAKKGLTSTIKKNTDITYKEIPLDIDVLRHFMTIWGSQPLHDGKYPLWGDWTPEYIISLDIDVLMFGSYLNNGLISIQFVFKWDNYILCNAPLYDKSLYSDREISKYMWLKLIEWSIDNNLEYLDLMGEGKNSWVSSVEYRPSSNSPGDFGYKWKFVPDKIKKSIPDKNFVIDTCEKCNHRWIEDDYDHRVGCKCKKLLIVAHADDEIVFFGNWLSENKSNAYVVCVCSDRTDEFYKSMEHYRITDYEIWDHKAELDLFKKGDQLKNQLKSLKDKHNWEQVVTHSQYGEYGHLQHIELHDMVVEIFDHENLYIYDLSEYELSYDKELVFPSIYRSEIRGLSEIQNAECTGSDWYKHSIHNNLMDHESIVKYDPVLLNINISLRLPNNSFDSYVKDVGDKLKERGHRVTYDDSGDVVVGFSQYDYGICVLFLVEDILSQPNLVPTVSKKLLDKIARTKRTIVGSKHIRDYIGNPLNVTYMNFSDTWDRLILNIESNILLTLKWSMLNKIDNLYTNIDMIPSVDDPDCFELHMDYIGNTIGECWIKFYDNTGKERGTYLNTIRSGVRYYFVMNYELKTLPMFVKVYTDSLDSKLIFSQTIYL